MSKQSYDDNFKLEVVNAYLNSPHGVRVISRSYGLPSKNYIARWMTDLKEKGLIPQDAEKLNAKSSMKDSTKKLKSPYEVHQKSARELKLEKEVLRLQAEVDFLKKLKELGRRESQNK